MKYLRFKDRYTILGENSYGKGSNQSIIPLKMVGAKLTISILSSIW